MKQPMTVAQLIERLSWFLPETPVMVECEDHYYNGPLAKEIELGIVAHVGPHAVTRANTISGSMHTVQVPSRWFFESDVEFFGMEEHVVERKPCVVLRSDHR